MTGERWKQVDEIFNRALEVDPARREAWLVEACGGDEALLAKVRRLLDADRSATREAFLKSSGSRTMVSDRTRSWHAGGAGRPARGPRTIGRTGPGSGTDPRGFSPRPAIVASRRPQPISETESVVRARLRELPCIYILILVMATLWRSFILGDNDGLLHLLDAFVIAGLGGVIAWLSSRRPISIEGLRAIELGMVGLLAVRVAIVEYRVVHIFSLRGDPAMAQLTVKNIVLVTCVLMLTSGLYVPKNWRRAAVMLGPLALLPFATLGFLFVRDPEALGWIERGWRAGGTPRYLLFTFDAMILLVVFIGSTFGAHAISRLRRQVVEARQLGQYRLRCKIGAGGMGEIYLAEHQLLKRPCAIKLIRASSVTDARALARFEREVRLTATLSHPNTVEIYDYGRTEDGTYYYVMEYLPGLSLADLVEQHGALPPGRVVYLLRQVCLALREAHSAGLIHRDIKPSNIFASRRGGIDDMAKLLDFGLVLPMSRAGVPQLSGEGQILGTPLFMSPEQATGEHELDERCDIYALGAVAYYLLTGRPPFDEADGMQLMIAHARDPVVPPSEICAGIPQDLERVVLRCLAKSPADRFPDSLSLERALSACACVADWDQDRAALWWRTAG